jgi:hypothetical protein
MHAPDRYELNAGWSLPNAYGVNRLVLLPKDPHRLFAYWEITPGLEEEMKTRHASWEMGQTILRLYDVEDSTYKEITLDVPANNWYLEPEMADRPYRAELGRILPDRRYIPILSSNTVRTPRDSISSVIDPRWKMFAFWQQRYYRQMISGLSSSEILFAENTAPKGGLQ